MLVIIGGSGMLLEASRALVAKSCEAVLLCGRQVSRYQPILQEAPHARFFKFDFSEKTDYARLRQYLEAQDDALSFLVWVHSPFYAFLADMLSALGERVRRVDLVKGSSGASVPAAWLDVPHMTVIRLGKHPSGNRWLTHAEICAQVLREIGDLS